MIKELPEPNSTAAHLLEAYLTIGQLLSGELGDADPLRLLEAAKAAIDKAAIAISLP